MSKSRADALRLKALALRLLTGLMPRMLHVPAASETSTVLPWVPERLRSEFAATRPGSTLMSQYFADIVFVQMLRVYLATLPEDAGWLRAFADEEIGEAIQRIHREPARRWTVDDLAGSVGLSRSTFSLRFKATVGVAHWDTYCIGGCDSPNAHCSFKMQRSRQSPMRLATNLKARSATHLNA